MWEEECITGCYPATPAPPDMAAGGVRMVTEGGGGLLQLLCRYATPHNFTDSTHWNTGQHRANIDHGVVISFS